MIAGLEWAGTTDASGRRLENGRGEQASPGIVETSVGDMNRSPIEPVGSRRYGAPERHPLSATDFLPMTRSNLRSFALLLPLVLIGCGDDPEPGSDDVSADTGIDASEVGPDATVDVSADATPDATIDADPDLGPPPPEWCESDTAHRWSPFDSEELEFFPDGISVIAEEDSPTGQRLHYTLDTAPWLEATPALLQEGLAALNDLSGYGTLGGSVIRLTAPVGGQLPATGAESISSTAWQWWDLDAEPPERIPYEVELLDDDHTVVFWPMRPLRRNARHAILVTNDAQGADGGCIAPAETTRTLLHGMPENPFLAAAAPVFADGLLQLGVDPADVSVLSVYRTHDDIGPMQRVAARIVEEPVEWGEWEGCAERGSLLECETSTTVLDSRSEAGDVDDTIEPREGVLPVTVWMPSEGEGPWPVLVYGHGLNSERDEGWEIAERTAEQGVVVISAEAVEHGEHPFIDAEDLGEPALRFLGIDLSRIVIDARAIRGNFNQTALDRLRLIQLLRTRPDFDGDGIDDIDPERVAYIGASLGALCGTAVLALSPDLDAGVLTIGGSRLLDIVRDSDLLGDFMPLIELALGSAELFDRLMPVAQHVVDPADPGVWTPHILQDRFDERTPPSVLAAVGLFDDVVPSSAGRTMARGMQLPHLPPVAEEVEFLEVLESESVSGNFADGARTAAFFQYDRVTRGDGPPERATHVRSAKSNESAAQIRVFFETWANGEAPVIIDPYTELGTPPLPGE